MNTDETQKPEPPANDQRTGCLGKAFAVFGALISGVWLLNFTFGIGEDSLPIVGNLDEVLATTILIYCLSILGVNTSWLTRGKPTTINNKEK